MKNFTKNIDLINMRLQEFEYLLKYSFKDLSILREALTHPSYVAEYGEDIADNQRFEFLGDAVLQLAMTKYLFERFPSFAEGKLTKVRSALTKDIVLAKFATQINLGSYLLLGKGETKEGGANRKSNLEDAFEAVIAAIYLDGGVESAQEFCIRFAKQELEDVEDLLLSENPKGALQEYSQANFKAAPVYKLLDMTGPEHKPIFTCQVTVNGKKLSTCQATTRRGAEKLAASSAMDILLNPKN